MSRLDRMRSMLRELEALVGEAREHERLMAAGLRESSSWSREEDREWIVWAAADAIVRREQAEASVEAGRALLARVQTLMDLGAARCCAVGEG